MKIEKESLSTTITDKERTEAVKDKYGVSYTKDWKKLIYAPEQLTSYTLKKEQKLSEIGLFISVSFLLICIEKKKLILLIKKRHPENLSR